MSTPPPPLPVPHRNMPTTSIATSLQNMLAVARTEVLYATNKVTMLETMVRQCEEGTLLSNPSAEVEGGKKARKKREKKFDSEGNEIKSGLSGYTFYIKQMSTKNREAGGADGGEKVRSGKHYERKAVTSAVSVTLTWRARKPATLFTPWLRRSVQREPPDLANTTLTSLVHSTLPSRAHPTLTSQVKFADVGAQWKEMSESAKLDWKNKANMYNAESGRAVSNTDKPAKKEKKAPAADSSSDSSSDSDSDSDSEDEEAKRKAAEEEAKRKRKMEKKIKKEAKSAKKARRESTEYE